MARHSGAGMTDDRFAILRSVRLDGPGRRLTLSEIISGDTPLPDLAELAQAAAAAWAGSWSVASTELRPAVPYPFDEEPLDAEAARALGGRIRRRLDAAAVIGGEEIAGCPAGWLRLLAAALDGLVRLSDADASAHAIRVAQVKEKFGTGRLYLRAEGTAQLRAEVQRVARWFEIGTHDRCALTGAPGVLRTGGWALTLSDAAEALRRRDREQFRRRIYPLARS
ncbi:hypothetical protein [Cereibacter azotoformans]|uniref:hypothetical protein n=1 Tax=Cereibacter azotoformans TaxID=43057 RepID=UPI00117AA9DC|nr:hypothetical protein [Cereibacter azotoformans]